MPTVHRFLPCLAVTALAASPARANDSPSILGVGPLVAAGAQTNVPRQGLWGMGAELTLNAPIPGSDILYGGLFAQAEVVNLQRPRFDLGGQLSVVGFVGLEAGGGYEGSDGSHAAALMVHLAPYVAVPLTSDVMFFEQFHGALTVGARLEIPVATVGVGARPPCEFEVVLTGKFLMRLGAPPRWPG